MGTPSNITLEKGFVKPNTSPTPSFFMKQPFATAFSPTNRDVTLTRIGSGNP